MIRIVPTAKNRIYYGWHIVAIAFFAHFMAIGSGFYVLNAFMQPLCEVRNWSRTDINLAPAFGMGFGFVGQFLYGTLVIRTGPRVLMSIGPIVGGIAFILLMRTQVLWQFYLLYVFLFLGNGAYSGIVASTAVNNWFVLHRGRALGTATAGMSLSGAILPIAAMILILKIGLAGASLWIGIMIMSVAPLAWFVVRDWPEDHGLFPDGLPPRKNIPFTKNADERPQDQDYAVNYGQFVTPARNMGPLWDLPSLIRTGAFWKLGLSFALLLIGVVGVMSQLKPRFADIGFSDMTAMGMMAATALFGAAGKYFWGMIADRFDPKRVVFVLALANSLGLAMAFFQGSLLALVLFVMIFGFSMGGIMSTYPIIVADFFGRESFPAVLRFVSLFLLLQITGYAIAGQSFDRTGSYDSAYMVFIFLDLVAAFLVILIRKPKLDLDRGWPAE